MAHFHPKKTVRRSYSDEKRCMRVVAPLILHQAREVVLAVKEGRFNVERIDRR